MSVADDPKCHRPSCSTRSARSRAFAHTTPADRIRDGYDRMLASVCYSNAPRPTFGEICARAAELNGRI